MGKPVGRMTDLLIDPTEDPPISLLGQSSSLPAQLGADIIWANDNGLCGVQRKTIPDLIQSSQQNGHLGVQIKDMIKSLVHAFLVIEGQPGWDREGNLMSQYARWSISQQEGVELSAQMAGVKVLHTRSALDTCRTVEHLVKWTMKKDHAPSLLARGNPQANGWGQTDDRLTGIHIMSGWPSVSVELAGRVYDFYGRVPCRHDIAEKPLTDVAGIGPKRAATLTKVLS